MEKVAFLNKLEPTRVEVAGTEVRLHFTLRAAARIEQELDAPYLDVVLEMLQAPGEGGKTPPPMSFDRQIALIRILMEEAGQIVDSEELRSLHMVEFTALAQAARQEMLDKMPVGDAKKNSPTGEKSSGGQS